MSLLILVKSTLKACCLPHEAHVSLVKEMVLVPVGPGQARLNLLQVRHAIEVHVLCVQEVHEVQDQSTFKWVMPLTCLSSMSIARLNLYIEAASLGLLLGTKAPVRTPNCIGFSFLSCLTVIALCAADPWAPTACQTRCICYWAKGTGNLHSLLAAKTAVATSLQVLHETHACQGCMGVDRAAKPRYWPCHEEAWNTCTPALFPG